ncbi:WSC domain-containing protein [Mycena leptocephala]|nr:WSC domain-containing protein [Mycena leptocephala]
MTVESCIAFCSAGGFSLAGVEFGDECYCDRALQSSGMLTGAKNCDVPCSGNLTEVCGAGNFLDVYWNGAPLPIIPQTVGTWKYYGCFSDSVASRALPNQTIPESVTVESCTSACKAKDFAVAGLEFGLECWCSSSIPTSSLLSDSDCSTGCKANTTEVCGGPSKLTVYEDTTGQICLSTTHSPNFNLTTSNCTHTAWTLQGCYTDTSASRALAGASYVNASAMTVESCIAFCSAGGFSLAGVEFGDECYCDHALQSSATLANAGNCNTPCSGNSTELCGAGNFVDVYWNGAPIPVVPQQVGTWKYDGCFSDSTTSRVLPNRQIISGGVTVESCTSACKTNGFAVAGLEFGQECWCGSSLPTSSLLSDSDCSTACTANTTEFCGGASKLTVYQDTTGQICLSTSHSANFNLAAVFLTPPTTGAASVPLHVTLIQTVTLVSWSILSVRSLPFFLGTKI